jgi:hypothetical protein
LIIGEILSGLVRDFDEFFVGRQIRNDWIRYSWINGDSSRAAASVTFIAYTSLAGDGFRCGTLDRGELL